MIYGHWVACLVEVITLYPALSSQLPCSLPDNRRHICDQGPQMFNSDTPMDRSGAVRATHWTKREDAKAGTCCV